jgi:hypothetical protein
LLTFLQFFFFFFLLAMLLSQMRDMTMLIENIVRFH